MSSSLLCRPGSVTGSSPDKPSIIDRFWSKVDRSGGPDACWPWTAGRLNNGYGVFYLNGLSCKAHRVAWSLANGRDVPDGLFMCHRCDRRECVNPAHLFVGTAADNADDMVEKGRQLYGERNPQRVLTEGQVIEMRVRAASGESTVKLAAAYGITQMQVSHICVGRSWRLTGGPRTRRHRIPGGQHVFAVEVIHA